jgi:hypothetical protein
LFEFEVRVTHGFAPWAAFFRRFAAGFQARFWRFGFAASDCCFGLSLRLLDCVFVRLPAAAAFASLTLLLRPDQLPQINFPTLSRQNTARQGWGTRRTLRRFISMVRAFVMPGICLLAWVEYHVGSI